MQRKLKKKTLVIVAIIGIALIIAAVIWVFVASREPVKQASPKYSTSSSSTQKNNGGSTSQTEQNSKGSDNTATTVTSQQVPVAPKGSVSIVDLEQAKGYINAKAVVSNFTTTQCVYSFTAQDARPVIRQIDGDCEGISIPQGEFELIGTYTLTVTAYNGTTEKISGSKDIAVQ